MVQSMFSKLSIKRSREEEGMGMYFEKSVKREREESNKIDTRQQNIRDWDVRSMGTSVNEIKELHEKGYLLDVAHLCTTYLN